MTREGKEKAGRRETEKICFVYFSLTRALSLSLFRHPRQAGGRTGHVLGPRIGGTTGAVLGQGLGLS